MEEFIKSVKDEWNRISDSKWYASLRTEDRIKQLVDNPASAFHPEVYQLIKKYFPEIKGKKVLLPSSGDNHAAFAFALLGADVTSTDISERQLENAAVLAEKLGLNINFRCENTMTLESVADEMYDLVYTSNGTHSWIVDIELMYQNIYRVLKGSGYSIMYDIHPFNRPFTGEPWKEPKVQKSYFESRNNLHWNCHELVNAMISAGLQIKEMAELQAVNPSFWFSYDELSAQSEESLQGINDWSKNPMAALPAWITLIAQKKNK